MYLKEFFSDFGIQNSSCKLLTLRICFYLGFNNSSGGLDRDLLYYTLHIVGQPKDLSSTRNCEVW